MIGAVIIAHGGLAAELLRTVEMVVGPQAQTKAISVTASQSSDHIFKQTQEAIQEVNTGQGVLVLTDMFGGTPSNISLSFLDKPNVEVITGVNLPMLVKLANFREQLPLQELKQRIVKYGRENIVIAGDMLNDNKLPEKQNVDKKRQRKLKKQPDNHF